MRVIETLNIFKQPRDRKSPGDGYFDGEFESALEEQKIHFSGILIDKDERIRKLESQVQQYTDDYAQLQERLLQDVESAAWAPPDDADTKWHLRLIARDAQKWSKTHCVAVQTFGQMDDAQTEQSTQIRLLPDVLRVLPSDKRLTERKVHILLQALLLNFAYSNILDNWAFFLHRRLQPDTVKSKIWGDTSADVMYSVMRLFEELEKCKFKFNK